MDRRVITEKELLSRIKISREDLEEWIKLQLVRPEGYTDDHAPLFSEPTLKRVGFLEKLASCGYKPQEIQKIVKKVGIPEEKDEKRKEDIRGKYLTVGNLAEQLNISPRTVKHWEDKGIIEPERRSEGGFRLYPKVYVYLGKLIQDLQLFGYSLEEIKVISGYFRDFLAIQENMQAFPRSEVSTKLEKMLSEIKALFDKMNLLKEGIKRWEDLLKKKRKEILELREKNRKRPAARSGGSHA